VTGSGSIAIPRRGGAKAARAVKLRTVTRSVKAGAKIRMKLKLSKRGVRRVRSAFRGRSRLKAKLLVTARDAAGNQSTVKRSVKLRR
jgi:hypothetical protein